jgi:uncharacterized coiled-coil protein SlyX
MCYESDQRCELLEKIITLQEEVITHLRKELVVAALEVKKLKGEVDGMGTYLAEKVMEKDESCGRQSETDSHVH